MRDVTRRLRERTRAGLAAARRQRRALRSALVITVTIAAAIALTAGLSGLSRPRPAAAGRRPSQPAAASTPAAARQYLSLLNAIGTAAPGSATAQAAAARARLGESDATAEQKAGLVTPGSGVLAAPAAPAGPKLPPPGPRREADLMVVAPKTLPARTVTAIKGLAGVIAVNQLDAAARVRLNGAEVAMIGVDPNTFRSFAAGQVARSTRLWRNVAGGDIAVSYLLGEQENIPLGGTVTVTGSAARRLTAGGFGTTGLAGVDAVVSQKVARSLGLPDGNALVVSAPHASLASLIPAIRQVLPAGAGVAPLVAQTEPGSAAAAGTSGSAGTAAGAPGVSAATGPALTTAQTRAFLTAALGRVGRPYVWGGSGPDVFDCSGLVQWSMRQAGVTMPRVASEQAQAGPAVAVSALQPGDLLFYHTDPTAPGYISHVAIYLGGGMMVQAPEPGMDVEVVPAEFGSEFAGAVQVDPQLAAAVAAQTGT